MNRYEILAAMRPCLDKGMKQSEVAKIIGCSQTEISRCCRSFGIDWTKQERDQLGEKNSQFKGGLGRSTIERTTRGVILRDGRDLFKCEGCGRISKDKEHPRHHKDEDRSNNSPDNIEVLCETCHMKEHNSRRKRGPNGQYLEN